ICPLFKSTVPSGVLRSQQSASQSLEWEACCRSARASRSIALTVDALPTVFTKLGGQLISLNAALVTIRHKCITCCVPSTRHRVPSHTSHLPQSLTNFSSCPY